MVGLPAFVLPLAQLILYPALQPAPLVHAFALWIAAAQTTAPLDFATCRPAKEPSLAELELK
jgi:hypothetical protein